MVISADEMTTKEGKLISQGNLFYIFMKIWISLMIFLKLCASKMLYKYEITSKIAKIRGKFWGNTI